MTELRYATNVFARLVELTNRFGYVITSDNIFEIIIHKPTVIPCKLTIHTWFTLDPSIVLTHSLYTSSLCTHSKPIHSILTHSLSQTVLD
jgi:hypothetical protein